MSDLLKDDARWFATELVTSNGDGVVLSHVETEGVGAARTMHALDELTYAELRRNGWLDSFPLHGFGSYRLVTKIENREKARDAIRDAMPPAYREQLAKKGAVQ